MIQTFFGGKSSKMDSICCSLCLNKCPKKLNDVDQTSRLNVDFQSQELSSSNNNWSISSCSDMPLTVTPFKTNEYNDDILNNAKNLDATTIATSFSNQMFKTTDRYSTGNDPFKLREIRNDLSWSNINGPIWTSSTMPSTLTTITRNDLSWSNINGPILTYSAMPSGLTNFKMNENYDDIVKNAMIMDAVTVATPYDPMCKRSDRYSMPNDQLKLPEIRKGYCLGKKWDLEINKEAQTYDFRYPEKKSYNPKAITVENFLTNSSYPIAYSELVNASSSRLCQRSDNDQSQTLAWQEIKVAKDKELGFNMRNVYIDKDYRQLETHNEMPIGKKKSDSSKEVVQAVTSVGKLKKPRSNAVFKCLICGKFCKSRWLLAEHARTHTREKPYNCIICRKAFSTSSSLNRHKRVHTGEKPYRCTICEKTFSQSHALRKHTNMHTGEKPHSCGICGKGFNQRCDLKRHAKFHTGEKQHKCVFCEKAYYDVKDLRSHESIHTGVRPYKCNACEMTFSNSRSLAGHQKRHADQGRQGSTIHQCRVCMKLFASTGDLFVHEISHMVDKKHESDKHGKKVLQQGQLFEHINPFNYIENATATACSLRLQDCGEAFTQSGSLRFNEIRPPMQRPYKHKIYGKCNTLSTDLLPQN